MLYNIYKQIFTNCFCFENSLSYRTSIGGYEKMLTSVKSNGCGYGCLHMHRLRGKIDGEKGKRLGRKQTV